MNDPLAEEWKSYIEQTTTDPSIFETKRREAGGMRMNVIRGELLALYQDANATKYPRIGNEYMRDDTMIGRIFAGLSQANLQNESATAKALAQAERFLGFRLTSVWKKAQEKDISGFQTLLAAEGKKNGYGYLFLGNDVSKESATTPTLPEVVSISHHTSQFYYTENDQNVTFRFDFTLSPSNPSNWAQRSAVYAVNGTTQMQIDNNALQGVVLNDNMTVTIPVRSFSSYVPSGFTTPIKIKLALWTTSVVENTPGMQGKYISPAVLMNLNFHNNFPIWGSSDNLSSLPPGPEREQEDLILKTLQFPLNGTVTQNLAKSSKHYSDALYSLDMSGGTGTEVRAPAIGKVEQIDLFAGQLILRHALPDGTQWFTTFYHLTNILENVTGISYIGLQQALDGMDISIEHKTLIAGRINSHKDVQSIFDSLGLPTEVKSKVQPVIDALFEAESKIKAIIADWKKENKVFSPASEALGKEGNEGFSTGKHLHMQVNKGDFKGVPVELYHWFNEQMSGVESTLSVEDRNDMKALWNTSANALVNSEERIAFKRKDIIKTNAQGKQYIDGSENATYAWEEGKTVEQMIRVVWKSAGKNAAGTDKFVWMSMNLVGGTTLVWSKEGANFGFTPLETYRSNNHLV
jgi:hypothetical protein